MQNNQDQKTHDVLSTLLVNQKTFLTFLKSRVANRADAEEILQSAFVKSIEQSDRIRDAESSTAWFYRLLRNAVIDHYRRRAVANKRLGSYARQLTDSTNGVDPATHDIVCQCVKALVRVLKPEFAELITKVDLEGDDVSAAARSIGITPGNARVRLHRARIALRREIDRSCRACAKHGCLDCTCGETAHPRLTAE
jgi:RNA polymerase sigma-70 factor (ECF subfamily)